VLTSFPEAFFYQKLRSREISPVGQQQILDARRKAKYHLLIWQEIFVLFFCQFSEKKVMS